MAEPGVKLPMGFHPDPDGSGKLRWWNGRQWTETYEEVSETQRLRIEITAAIEDYCRPGLYPPPYQLAPNLQLASLALAEITSLEEQLAFKARTNVRLASRYIEVERELQALQNPPPEPPECQACYQTNGHKEGCPAA
jgi:hypothetical protein